MKDKFRVSILFLIVAVSFAIVGISGLHDWKIFKLILALLVLAHVPSVLLPYFQNRKIFYSRWFLPSVYFLSSLFTAIFIFRFWNFPLYDDAGFTLRYLDNFARGHFYAFNMQDGPVFGVSSFSQGIICGFLSWTHLLSPDKSIFITALLGLVVISYFLFRILHHYEFKSELLVLSFIVIVYGSKFFLNSMTTGMETPVHLAIVLAAIYFFITDKSKPMWLLLSASVISKLDAVPLALTLGAVHLWHHRKEFFPLSLKNRLLKDLFFFVLIPVGAWVVFATLVFGSPLPQSAFAKIFFHNHPDDYWFPFFKYFIKDEFRRPLFLIFLILFARHLYLVAFVKNVAGIRTLAFGLSLFSSLVLYYFYNPGEQMMWYYAMPDFFLIAQTVISFVIVVEHDVRLLFKPLIFYFTFIACSLLLFYDVYGGRSWLKEYLSTVEQERIYLGKFLQTITTEKDTVLTAHGHIARYTPAYVIDMSGLNSKLATKYKNILADVASKTNPAITVSHGSALYIHTMDSLGYSLVHSSYDINEYYWPAWRVFSRKISTGEKTRITIPDSARIKARETRKNFGMLVCFGDTISIKLPDDTSLSEIRFGIKRINRTSSVIMNIVSGSDTLATELKSVAPEKDYKGEASHYTDEAILKIDSATAKIKNKKLVLRSSVKAELKIIEPVFLLHR